MFLYDKTDHELIVYKFLPNPTKLKEYRKAEMHPTLSSSQAVIKAIGQDIDQFRQRENVNTSIFDTNPTNSSIWGGIVWYDFETYKMSYDEKLRQKILLDHFYNGNYTDKRVEQIKIYKMEIQKHETMRYLLITRDYQHNHIEQHATMDDIIVIPKALYLLQMLEQGEFALVQDEEIGSPLQAFDLYDQPISRFPIDQLKELYGVNLLPGTFNDMMSNVNTTQKILRKIKH